MTNITAKASKASKGTGSVAKATRAGRKPKEIARLVERVALEMRDIAALRGILRSQMTPEPAEPVEPEITEEMTSGAVANAYREYANAVRNHPFAVEQWRNANAELVRIDNALASAQNANTEKRAAKRASNV